MSPFIKDSSVQAVAQAANLVDVAGQYTTLRKRGSTYVGLCPFHSEKTPSFSVNAEKNVFYCFGCGQGGDVFTFVQRIENLSFVEAVEALAQRFGVVVEYEEGVSVGERGKDWEKRLLLLLEKAATFFQRYLWASSEGERARQYVQERGLGREILEEFRIGLAPSGWRSLLDRALRQGFTERDLEAAGLAVVRDGRAYDRFRGRLMFPLVDHRGRVVGFGGRTLADEQPKYLNSPEGPLYRKGNLLYGLYQARKAIAQNDEVLVVEGYTDVLAVAQAGVRNVVASMGTALTEQQLALLSRFTRNVVFMFDADRAGADAALRSGRLARRLELRAAVVTLPQGADPADIATRRPSELAPLVSEKMSLLRYEITRALDRFDVTTAEGRVLAFGQIRRLLQQASSPKEREEEVRAVADRLRLSPESVALLLQWEHGQGGVGAPRGKGGSFGEPGSTHSSYRTRVAAPELVLERRVLIGMIAFPEMAEQLFGALSTEHFQLPDHQELFRELAKAHEAGLSLDEAARRLAAGGGPLASLCAGLIVEGGDDVYSAPLLQHDYLRLHEQHIGRVIAALREQLERGELDLEDERRLLRLELLQHDIRQALADIEEEQAP